jgi:triosephosphate isomerase
MMAGVFDSKLATVGLWLLALCQHGQWLANAFHLSSPIRSSRASPFLSPLCLSVESEVPVWYEDSFTTGREKRRPIMAGNWKLNPVTYPEACNLLKLLATNFINHRIASSEGSDGMPEVVVFPPFPFLGVALQELEGSGIKVGAQNIGLYKDGAVTGEVSASMIRSMGCDYAMLGHSERRALFDESDEDINKKVHLCLKESNLSVILCVGETEVEYESDLLRSVVDVQIKKGLMGVQAADLDRIVIAYEPVWAIGTGKVATPEQAQTAHIVVRRTLSEMYGTDVARRVRIQYGGSVKPENVNDLMSMPDIDGALVGGASLTADSFTRIVDGGVATPAIVTPRPRELTARECVSTRNVLGESPVWSVRDQCLYWISAPEEEIWTWNLKDAPYRRLMDTMLGCVAVKEGAAGSIVLGGERAILSLSMSSSTQDFASGPSTLCERPDRASATRPNDGRVDRQGRLVFGMYNNYHRSGSSEGENNAGLFRLDDNLEYESLLDYKFRVSNCICFPSDGETIFFCDTPTRKLYAFDYPKEKGGKLTNRRLVWTVPSNLPGGPDGAQVDAEGCIWIALSGASRVVRVNPATGTVDIVVHLPVKCPTSCTFGGPDLDDLFITTRGPDGGGLYRVKMPFGIKGLPEPEFKVKVSKPDA